MVEEVCAPIPTPETGTATDTASATEMGTVLMKNTMIAEMATDTTERGSEMDFAQTEEEAEEALPTTDGFRLKTAHDGWPMQSYGSGTFFLDITGDGNGEGLDQRNGYGVGGGNNHGNGAGYSDIDGDGESNEE
jgi:hypothetical protein